MLKGAFTTKGYAGPTTGDCTCNVKITRVCSLGLLMLGCEEETPNKYRVQSCQDHKYKFSPSKCYGLRVFGYVCPAWVASIGDVVNAIGSSASGFGKTKVGAIIC